MSKCEKCIYRTRIYMSWCDKQGEIGCAYILRTGHMRACPPADDCTKFVKGKQLRVKNPLF